ncbi:glycosyltransferase family 4 protein [Rhodanobacter glycinis]|uniref:Glycosyltransferase family 4 protein n=1 Tax=Rhodanobacter glycinis TaxID=582702 RepID=A0A5B9E3T4_9GAMM|nr:glycosyltransferase family 4 protein [Rhodanobacter glycinis]QEE25635.1 glycosyltransferase family 4 protein [Rhodanobacter glycinis]
MRFLLVASFPESILKFRGALIDSLLANGLLVHVAAPGLSLEHPVRVALERKGVVVHTVALDRAGTNPVGDLVSMWKLFCLMRQIRPDIVLGYTIKPVIYGSLAAWMAGVPRRFALVTGLGYAFTGERKSALTKMIQSLYTFALSRVSKVFFQNPDDQALFRTRGILADRAPSVVVNGSGVDVSEFAAQSLSTSGSQCFLMIGRLLGDKGVREYSSAAKAIRQIYPDVRCLIVGWVDENPDAIGHAELECWIADGSVEFLGKLADVRPAISACTVYVLPSYREGTPRTVLEAMAMGRAVITTDAPGCRETVIDGDNGFLVPVKSVDALVNAMKRFIGDAALAPRMGARSRQIAVDRYDVHKVNAVMLREMGITQLDETKVTQRE